MTDLIEQITYAFEREQASGRKAVNANEIPVSYDAVTPAWLTHVLCKEHPDARVVSHRLDTPDDGMTNRMRIFVEYNDAGRAAKLPGSVFCKASNTLDTRIANAKSGLIEGENAFYTQYREQLNVESPDCYLAAYDPHSYNSIVVLEDLAQRGIEFCNHDTEITRTMAESQLKLLAGLHGRFYASEKVENSNLPTFETIFRNIDGWLGWEDFCTRGFIAAEAVIPPQLFRRLPEIWPITLKSVAMHGSLPRTFTHNDVHLRNWSYTPSRQMVLCDWQCFGKGHWGRDFAYALTTSLTVENRRNWERELLQFYLEQLRASGGHDIPFDEAWSCYRQHLFSALTFWTSTVAVGGMHPQAASLEFTRRITTAIDDLNAMSSFG